MESIKGGMEEGLARQGDALDVLRGGLDFSCGPFNLDGVVCTSEVVVRVDGSDVPDSPALVEDDVASRAEHLLHLGRLRSQCHHLALIADSDTARRNVKAFGQRGASSPLISPTTLHRELLPRPAPLRVPSLFLSFFFPEFSFQKSESANESFIRHQHIQKSFAKKSEDQPRTSSRSSTKDKARG